MANTLVETFAPPGLTLTLKLYAEGSDTEAASVALAEEVNRAGYYQSAVISAALSGFHSANILTTAGGNLIASGWVYLEDTADAYFVSDQIAGEARQSSTRRLDDLVAPDNAGIAAIASAVSALPSSSSIADAVWDESLSGHNVGGSTGKALRQLKEGVISVDGSVDDSSATTTTFVSNLTETTDGFYHDKVIVFISGDLAGQARHIETYTGSTKSITVSQGFTSAPADGDEFLILSTHEHSINEIQSGLATSASIAALNDLSSADVTAAVPTVGQIADAVWNELYAGHVIPGSFSALLQAISGASFSIPGTISGSASTASVFETSLTQVDNAYNGQIILMTSGTLTGQSRAVLTSENADGKLILAEPFTGAPATADTFTLLPGHLHIQDPLGGLGTVYVDQDYGGSGNLTYRVNGTIVEDAQIYVYSAADYNAGNRENSYIQAVSRQLSTGVWERPVRLNPGAYKIQFYKPRVAGPDTFDVTVTES